MILPPKKRRDNTMYNANNEILNNDGSKINDVQIRACASLNATFSLDRTEMAEEEEKKKRLAEVKEAIVGIFYRKRVEYLSIDLLF